MSLEFGGEVGLSWRFRYFQYSVGVEANYITRH